MNDNTFTPIKAVFAIYAMPRYTRQKERDKQQRNKPSCQCES